MIETITVWLFAAPYWVLQWPGVKPHLQIYHVPRERHLRVLPGVHNSDVGSLYLLLHKPCFEDGEKTIEQTPDTRCCPRLTRYFCIRCAAGQWMNQHVKGITGRNVMNKSVRFLGLGSCLGSRLTHSACDPFPHISAPRWQTSAGRRWRLGWAGGKEWKWKYMSNECLVTAFPEHAKMHADETWRQTQGDFVVA